MPRVAVDFRSVSNENYKNFKLKNPTSKITKDVFIDILYTFNELCRDTVLEKGIKVKLPLGIGDISIIKYKRKKLIGKNNEFINLPIDWQKTKLLGKKTYNFNYDTEGYFFRWWWFKRSSMLKFSDLWSFKPLRISSRMVAHYLKQDLNQQFIYQEYNKN